MRKLSFIAILGCIFMLSTASMCSSDDSSDDNNNNNGNASTITSSMMQGTWRVTLFNEDGTNHTNDFSNYNFTFGASNVLTATNGSATQTGFWSVTSDDSNDDNEGGDVDLNIIFISPANFSDLIEDWHILERTSDRIRLQHVSGGNGGTDVLTFEK